MCCQILTVSKGFCESIKSYTVHLYQILVQIICTYDISQQLLTNLSVGDSGNTQMKLNKKTLYLEERGYLGNI